MKQLMLLLLMGVAATPVLAQKDKCPFGGGGTSRNDQYSKSAKQAQKNSQSEMDKQGSQFDKPKYAQTVKAKKPKQNYKAKL